jgi:hypothetical protein
MTTSPKNFGRPPGNIPKDDLHLRADADVTLYFRMKFLDTFTGRPKVGAMSELVTRLLREEMNRELREKEKGK